MSRSMLNHDEEQELRITELECVLDALDGSLVDLDADIMALEDAYNSLISVRMDVCDELEEYFPPVDPMWAFQLGAEDLFPLGI